jgi:uncharacterized protein (TIGR02996 family)
MTAQVGDRIRYKDEQLRLFANPPLHGETVPPGANLKFKSGSSANWRGYVATWEFRDNILFLADVSGRRDRRDIDMHEVFPGHEAGIQADWVTARLRVPRGECIDYVHMGYASTYERDLWLAVHAGRLVFAEEIDNRTLAQVSAEVTPQLEALYGAEAAAFIRAIRTNPAERTTRLVYADWLEECDDPRGELIRRDAALLKLGKEWLATRKRDNRGPVGWAGYPADDSWLARCKCLLGPVTDWLWLRLMDYPLPRDKWGDECITW